MPSFFGTVPNGEHLRLLKGEVEKGLELCPLSNSFATAG